MSPIAAHLVDPSFECGPYKHLACHNSQTAGCLHRAPASCYAGVLDNLLAMPPPNSLSRPSRCYVVLLLHPLRLLVVAIRLWGASCLEGKPLSSPPRGPRTFLAKAKKLSVAQVAVPLTSSDSLLRCLLPHNCLRAKFSHKISRTRTHRLAGTSATQDQEWCGASSLWPRVIQRLPWHNGNAIFVNTYGTRFAYIYCRRHGPLPQPQSFPLPSYIPLSLSSTPLQLCISPCLCMLFSSTSMICWIP